MRKVFGAAVAACVSACALMGGVAKAAYILDIAQSNGNVVATGTGSVDPTGLSFEGFQDPNVDAVDGSTAYVEVGNTNNGVIQRVGDIFSQIAGPANFGTGPLVAVSSTRGYIFGINGSLGEIIVPAGYFPGTNLGPSVAIWNNTTIAALGLKTGVYTYTWGTQNTDSFTVDITTAPLPAAAPMFGASLAALGAVGFILKRTRAAKA